MWLTNFLAQSFRLPAPTLSKHNLPDQRGRVFIVTGGYAGIGYELSRILYLRNGTVYIAGRTKEKAISAIEAIKSACPDSNGRLEFLHLDLADLTTIKKAVDEFLSKESRLDVLTNNAGVMLPPEGSTSAQGYELQMATNVLGPYLLMVLLMPLLVETAASSPPGSVRVTWAASIAVDTFSPSSGGMIFDDKTGAPIWSNNYTNYGMTKVANLMLATEIARRFPFQESKVITNAWNPGNLRSELQRHTSKPMHLATSWMLFPVVQGAYTELFAGWSEEAGREENNAKYIWPWGRFGTFREDIVLALKSEYEGGTGKAAKLWEWCEKETGRYA